MQDASQHPFECREAKPAVVDTGVVSALAALVVFATVSYAATPAAPADPWLASGTSRPPAMERAVATSRIAADRAYGAKTPDDLPMTSGAPGCERACDPI